MREQITTTLDKDVIQMLRKFQFYSNGKIKSINIMIEHCIRKSLMSSTVEEVLNSTVEVCEIQQPVKLPADDFKETEENNYITEANLEDFSIGENAFDKL